MGGGPKPDSLSAKCIHFHLEKLSNLPTLKLFHKFTHRK